MMSYNRFLLIPNFLLSCAVVGCHSTKETSKDNAFATQGLSASSTEESTTVSEKGNNSTDLELDWKLDRVGSKDFKLHYRIRNLSGGDVYVLDRLWKLDASNHIVTDPARIYRFERDGTLRLLLGASPLPRSTTVTFRNVPHVSLLNSGAVVDRDIVIASPVEEYGAYGSDSVRLTKTVGRVNLIVQYLQALPELRVQDAPEGNGALLVLSPVAALQHTKMVFLERPFSGIEVSRYTGKFDRIALPGEVLEPLNP